MTTDILISLFIKTIVSLFSGFENARWISAMGFLFSLGYFQPDGIYSIWLMVAWPYELGKDIAKRLRR